MTRILAVGDSYTAGEAIAESGSWPRLLEQAPPASLEPLTVTVIARTGWTASEARAGLAAAAPAGIFDAVAVQVGVNDQYRGGTPEAFGGELRRLLDDAARFAGDDPARIVFLSIPDWSVTPFAAGRDREAIARQIDAHNDVARRVAAAAGAAFADVTGVSRTAGSQPGLVAADGLHPAEAMYRHWLPVIRAALEDVAS